MKKVALHSFLLFAAAVIGLSAGIALRGKGIPQPGNGPKANPFPSTIPEAKHRASPSPSGTSDLATKLERDLSTSSGVTRWLLWLEAIERAQPVDFPRLAKLAQKNPTALRFVAARWAESYPRHLFDTLVEAFKNPGSLPVNELAIALFRDWPKRDPDSAVEALSGPENFGVRSYWRELVAEVVIEADAERGIRLMAEWDINRFGPGMQAIAKWASADPRHAAEFTLQNPAGYVSQLTMETIAKEWTKTDPAGALEFAATRTGDLALTLAHAALKEWSGRNLNEAANWLAQTDEQTRNRLAPALVEPWAKQDAQNALAWCEANLSGSSLIQSVGSVLKGAADTDVTRAAALVSSLSPSSVRAEAAVAVAKKWFPELSSREPVNPAALSWLKELDPASVKSVLDEVAWGWATSDPTSMAGFLLSSNAAQVASSPFTILARQLVDKNPAGAFEWASALSNDRALTAGSEAFATWRSSRPEAATHWLNALPEGDPRRQPYFESAVRTLAWSDPQAPAQFAAMSAADRSAARSVIQQMTLPEDRRASLLAALSPR